MNIDKISLETKSLNRKRHLYHRRMEPEFEFYGYCYGFWLMDFYVSFAEKKYKCAAQSLLKEIKIQQELLSMPVIRRPKKDKNIPGKSGPKIYLKTEKGECEFSLSGFSDIVSTLGIGLYLFLKKRCLDSYYQMLLPDFMKLKEISLKLFKEYSTDKEIISFYRWGKKQGDPYVVECDYKSIDPRLGELLSGFVPMLEYGVNCRLNYQSRANSSFYFNDYYFIKAVGDWNKGKVKRCFFYLAKEIKVKRKLLAMPLIEMGNSCGIKVVCDRGEWGGEVSEIGIKEKIEKIRGFLFQVRKKIMDIQQMEKVSKEFVKLQKEYENFHLRVRNEKEIIWKRYL